MNITEIKKLKDTATKGEWRMEGSLIQGAIVGVGRRYAITVGDNDDAKFIAALPQIAQLAIDQAKVIDEQAAHIESLRAALEFECGDRCNSEYNPCNARSVLMETPAQSLEKIKAEARKEADDMEVINRIGI